MINIVIIDDNILTADGIRENINWEQFSCNVIGTFYDAKSAITFLESNYVNIIISDIKMPGLSGLELSDLALKKQPDVKIILISAYSEFQYAKKALRLGVFDFIEKPIDYIELSVVLQKAIVAQESERRQLEELKKSRPVLIQNLYYNLVHNFCDDCMCFIKNYSEYITLNLDFVIHWCVILYIEKLAQLRQQESAGEYWLTILKLRNTFSEKIPQEVSLLYILNENENQIFLFAAKKQVNIVEILTEIIDSLSISESYEDLGIKVAIGKGVGHLKDIHLSYRTACEALESRFFFREKYILTSFDKKSTVDDQTTMLRLENNILESVSNRDIISLKAEIKELETILSTGVYRKNSILAWMYSVLSRILMRLANINGDVLSLQKEIMTSFYNIDTFSSVNSLCCWFENFCKQACDKATDSIFTHHENLCKEVEMFIQDHYSDPNLSLTSIAQKVNMSAVYLSSLYKKQTGKNITDSIIDIRMNTAKDFIRNTTMSIRDVSQKVGYSNQYYFSACFKKYYGVAPLLFRNSEHM